MQLVLGSQSPRRREILGFFSLPFEQATPPYDEESVEFKGDPIQYVKILASGKARSLAPSYREHAILTADTIVYRNGKIFGKPRDEEEALSFMKELNGEWHSVFTGTSLYYLDQEFQEVEETRVQFRTLTEEQMRSYYQKLHYLDKAGGYMIQQAGSVVVRRIEGCYYNVMGLPINSLLKLFPAIGIDLWNYLK